MHVHRAVIVPVPGSAKLVPAHKSVGNHVGETGLPDATKAQAWMLLSGVDVEEVV